MTLTPFIAVLALGAATLVAGLAGVGLLTRALRRQRATLEGYARDLATLQSSLQQQLAFSAKVGTALKRLLAASEALQARMERLELRGGEPSYGRAIAVVQRGAGADTLVRDFGLSKAEAELVSVVHARRAVS
jgi:hypothetical protein